MTDNMHQILNRIETLRKRFGLVRPDTAAGKRSQPSSTEQFTPEIHAAAQTADTPQQRTVSDMTRQQNASSIINTITSQNPGSAAGPVEDDTAVSALSELNGVIVKSALDQYKKQQDEEKTPSPTVDSVR
ncbi:MAG: hypothetical protein ACOC2H_05375 [Spirochaetota bacterium]